MISDDEKFLVCLGCLVIPAFRIGLIVPNRASVIVGVCVVCVNEDCTVENTNYVSTCSSASSDGLLWLPSAYRVVQADPC